MQGREEREEKRGGGPRPHHINRAESLYQSAFHHYKQIPKITNNSHFGGFDPQPDSIFEAHSGTAYHGKAV